MKERFYLHLVFLIRMGVCVVFLPTCTHGYQRRCKLVVQYQRLKIHFQCNSNRYNSSGSDHELLFLNSRDFPIRPVDEYSFRLL